jgi:ankyrin repeat protein
MPGPISTPDDNGGRTSESSSPRDTSKSPTCWVRHGADINTLSDDGKTALDIAIEQENEAVAALLRERGGLRADELS